MADGLAMILVKGGERMPCLPLPIAIILFHINPSS
jgi:hypothetical protein